VRRIAFEDLTVRTKAVSLISVLLTVVAILSSLLGIGFFIIWLRGTTSILFPGLGLVVATPIVALLLLIVAVVALLFAMVTR